MTHAYKVWQAIARAEDEVFGDHLSFESVNPILRDALAEKDAEIATVTAAAERQYDQAVAATQRAERLAARLQALEQRVEQVIREEFGS